ncbi:MAG: hypothetical protein J0L99_22000 [Chitinophagales bacterium]|nr:hypothetical protein [Chitinophagales bacterium]
MLKHCTLLLALLSLPCFLHANTIPLKEAVDKGLIKVNVKALGGHSGACIQVQIIRLGQSHYKISIPAGHVFYPTDSSTQNLIVVKEELATLALPRTTLKVQGLCSQAHDASPQAEESFSLGEMAGGALQKMAEHLSRSLLYQDPSAQTAIWAMSDSTLIPGIAHAGLLSTACQIMGVAIPEYRIRRLSAAPVTTRTTTTSGTRPRRAPAFVREPMLVEGFFKYDSGDKPALISAYLIDSSGQKVQTFFEDQKQDAGVIARYKFEYKTTKLPPGRYEVVYYVDRQLKKRIVVRY